MNRIRTHTKTKNQPTKTYTQRKWNCKESCNAIIFIQYFNVFVFAITFTKQLLYLSLKQKTNKKKQGIIKRKSKFSFMAEHINIYKFENLNQKQSSHEAKQK